ncbi:hypothetical protein QJQ45_014508 [Haematococcus lacustris]|nr:hypothetical protein QJQ45_014508 [Haematococcus lacustris]
MSDVLPSSKDFSKQRWRSGARGRSRGGRRGRGPASSSTPRDVTQLEAGDSSSEGSSHGGEADARVPLPLSTGADLQELLEQAAQQYQYRHWGGLGDEAAQLPVGFADLNPAAVSVCMWADMQDLEFELDLEQLAASLMHLPLTLLTGVPAAFLQGVDLQSAPAAGGQQQARQPGSSAGAAEQAAGVPPAAPLISTHPCTAPSLPPGQPGRPGPPLPFTSMGSSKGSGPPPSPPSQPPPSLQPGLSLLAWMIWKAC